MAELKVVKYSSSDFDRWNKFLDNSKNATFLFHRNFMDYHRDRFKDHSLMIYQGEKILALLPAHEKDGISSHNGLTYGGLILEKNIKFDKVLSIFGAVLKYLAESGFQYFHIKKIPSIYELLPSDEIDYLVHHCQAETTRIDTLSVIDLNSECKISSNRLEGVKRGERNGLEIREETNLEFFWNEILIPNLKEKHSATPVHNFEEITRLKSFFPKNIRQFNVYHNNIIVAGTTIFENKNVAHSQYISGNQQNNELGSLDFLYYHLIKDVFKNKRFFDFGTSNENGGKNLNRGLLFWKEGFGARTMVQRFYKIPTANYKLLDSIFI